MTPRPRKRKRAAASAANREMTIEKATTTRQTTMLTNSADQKLGWGTSGPAPFTVNAAWKLAQVKWAGHSCGGVVSRSSLGLKASISM